MPVELQPGDPRKVGPYRLVGRLGSGGMGRVFLARSPGGRQVAVKLVRTELAEQADFRARFAREVAAARTVSGLFTAPVVDADLDGPVPWLATAYVAGPSLADAVASHGPLPVASVLALAAGLAEGLGAIHAAGIVHRDLKPSNVLLAEDGPRVIDFGISRAAEASVLTGTGLVVGSPGFMSPEQAEGRDVGPPSDVFSLGAVLTFAATGAGPFGTGTTATLLYRVVHTPPATGDLPYELRSLVERCLAKDPEQRPTTGQLLAELDAAHPAAGWLPAPITQAFPVHTLPEPAPVGTAAADSPPTESAATSRPPPPQDAAGPSTITATPGGTPHAAAQPGPSGTGQPPHHGHRRRLAWALVTAGLIAVSVAAAVALVTGMTGQAHHLGAGGAQATSPTVLPRAGFGQRLYVVTAGTVSVIDAGTNAVAVAIPVGAAPRGVAVSPDGRRVYVTNYGSGTVSVIDTGTNTVIATIPVGGDPQGLAITHDGRHVYVADGDGNVVSVIDTASRTVTATIATGMGTSSVAVTPDSRRVYAVNNGSGTVSVIDTGTNTVIATIPVGAYPAYIAITPDGLRTYVSTTAPGPGTLTVIDTANNTVTGTIKVGVVGSSVAVSPDGRRVYVTNYGSGTVSVIDTGTVIATIPVGINPNGVAVNADSRRAYVANGGSGTVSIVDTARNTVTGSISVGGGPGAMAMTPAGK